MSKSKVNLWETHTSTILSITLVMFLLGLCLLVEYHIYRATRDMQERITFKVDLNADISDEDAALLKGQIEAIPYVKHVDYISREQAAEIFSEDLDDDFVGFIGYNPLYPSMMVNLYAEYLPETRQDARAESIARFSADVSNLDNVVGVAYQENIVNELNDFFFRATWFLIIFMALLMLISILMISSTIRIALYAQRDTIRTMQLVGAASSPAHSSPAVSGTAFWVPSSPSSSWLLPRASSTSPSAVSTSWRTLTCFGMRASLSSSSSWAWCSPTSPPSLRWRATCATTVDNHFIHSILSP